MNFCVMQLYVEFRINPKVDIIECTIEGASEQLSDAIIELLRGVLIHAFMNAINIAAFNAAAKADIQEILNVDPRPVIAVRHEKDGIHVVINNLSPG